MNATPFRLLLTETPAHSVSRRPQIRRIRAWIDVDPADLLRSRIEGVLFLVLTAALGFALGAFVLAM